MKTSDVMIPISMLGDPEPILQRYREMVAKGTAPRMAEILASRHFPAALTDTTRMAGVPPLEETNPAYARRVKEAARKAGIVVTDNSRYNPTMADHRRGGDPNAWTHAGDGISTLKQRLVAQGGGSEDLGVAIDSSRDTERFEKKREAVMKRRRAKSAYREAQRDAIKKIRG